jgi:hypothetical protein
MGKMLSLVRAQATTNTNDICVGGLLKEQPSLMAFVLAGFLRIH